MPALISCERRSLITLGVETAYYRKGDGPTIVLLHGGGPGACSDVNWCMNFTWLAERGYDVIAFDQPGFGYSSAPDDHSIEFRFRHAVSFLEALNLKNVFLVGNSIGGLLSTLMYHRRDTLSFSIKGMILAAPFPYFDISDVANQKYGSHRRRLAAVEPTYGSVLALCQNTFFNDKKLTDELVRFRLKMIEKNFSALQGRRTTGNGFASNDVRDKSVLSRNLMIWGTEDRSLPVQIGLEAIDRFPATEFVFLPECGHWPQTEHAGKFNSLVGDFLAAST